MYSPPGPRTRSSRPAVLLIIAAAATVVACDGSWKLEPSPDSVPMDSILRVTRTQTAPLVVGRAPGEVTDFIVATFRSDADTRFVTFTASAGVFPDAGLNPRELRVRAEPVPGDDRHVSARVAFRPPDSLRTSFLVDTATVRATVGDFGVSVRVPLACLSTTRCGRRGDTTAGDHLSDRRGIP